MIRLVHAAALALLAPAAACSNGEETTAPAVTGDEQRALAEARAMIPTDEIAPRPAASVTSEETPTP